MKRSMTALAALIVVFAMMLTGCSAPPAGTQNSAKPDESKTAALKAIPKDKVVAGFVYIGPIGDEGYTYAHNQGRLALEQSGVKTLYKESVPENDSCVKVMEDMIAEGANIIFATSFGYMDYVERVAKDHPDVYFFHCSGYKSGPNFSNYFGRIYQARYLSGIVAGMKTKTNEIGYVGAFPIPEVVRGINAFTLGARSVNPKVTVHVMWTNTWYDPAKEKDAADTLFKQYKIDVMAQHQDTTAPQLSAQEHNAFAIGYNSSTPKAAPKAYLTAPIWNWGTYYAYAVNNCINGTFKTESFWKGLSEDVVRLDTITSLAAPGTQAKVDEATAKIKGGSWDVFTGPIKDQTGAVKVAEGTKMTDKEMLSFDWFVEGVDGKIK